MTKSATVYCDESGNDGSNYLSPDEPFFVMAGWIVPSEAHADAAVAVEKVRVATREQLKKSGNQPDPFELHSDQFKKRRGDLSQFLKTMTNTGLVPIYIVAEKRYCIAAKIVETFVDSVSNEIVAPFFDLDSTTKTEMANCLLERLKPRTLKTFARAYRNPSPQAFEDALTLVVADCETLINPELAAVINGCRQNLAEMAKVESDGAAAYANAAASLNLPCFVQFMNLIERYCQVREVAVPLVVHDTQQTYDEGFLEVFKVMQAKPVSRTAIVDGELWGVSSETLERIESLEFRDSKDELLVQASDMLAGAVARSFRDLVAGKFRHDQEIALAKQVLTPVLQARETVGMILPESTIAAAGELCGITTGYALPDTGSLTDCFVDNLGLGDSLKLLPTPDEPTSREFVPPDGVVHKVGRAPMPVSLIVRDSDEAPLIMNHTDPSSSVPEELRTYIPMFHLRSEAERYLTFAGEDFTEPHRVVEYDVPDIPKLVASLRRQLAYVQFAFVFEQLGDAAPMPIAQYADNIEKIVERTVRAIRSGIGNVQFQKHQIAGSTVSSFLLSNGEYAAGDENGQNVVSGKTREAAVQLYVDTYL